MEKFARAQDLAAKSRSTEGKGKFSNFLEQASKLSWPPEQTHRQARRSKVAPVFGSETIMSWSPGSKSVLEFRRLLGLWLLWTVVSWLCPASAPAAQDVRPAPWQISADNFDYDQPNGIYRAHGNVVIKRGQHLLLADWAEFHSKTRQVVAGGHVRLTSGKDILRADRIEMDLETETGTIENGSLFLAENHFYIFGDRIRKIGPATYTAEKATVTTCDGPDPDWRITGRDVEVTIEGYGFVSHAALWARKLPVLYSPYLVFPVKLKRQTGLLTPWAGYSDRRGLEYVQPFFWAISASTDATVHGHYMDKRGLKGGLEYRWVRDTRSRGTIMLEGFIDRQIDDGSPAKSAQWGYPDDTATRPNSDRYWLRGKIDQGLGKGFNAKLDLDLVSDQDYLREFRNAYAGYNDTRNVFNKTYGRALDDYDDPVRLNRLNLNRTWPRMSLNADLQWYDDVIKRREGSDDDTLQRLPSIDFNVSKSPLAYLPLKYRLASNYTYLYRQDGDRAHRLDLHPRLLWPASLGPYLTLEPSAGLRYTAWQMEKVSSDPNLKRFHQRTIYDLELTLASQLYRVFRVGQDRLLKHSLQPEVIYRYVPDQDQTSLPDFDSVDRIEADNLITYSLNNLFTLRTPRPNRTGIENERFDYLALARLKIRQSYDINKANRGDPRPFSDIFAELDITPGRWFLVDSDASWSCYDNRMNAYNLGVGLFDGRGDRIYSEYRYRKQTVEQEGKDSILVTAEMVVTGRLQLRGAYERNRLTGTDIRKAIGFTYNAQCWRLEVDYSREQDEEKVSAMIHLSGLGSVGG